MNQKQQISNPQVLFLGNGLMRAFGGNSWNNLIKMISKRDDLPDELKCPFPLQAILATNDHINEATREYAKAFWGAVGPELQTQLRTLIAMRFDDILTTNYSYEIESAALAVKCVSKSFLEKTCKNQESGKKVEPKYLLQSCQVVPVDQHINRVWHIHGEARKPNSMILGHYYYANMLHRMVSYLEKRGTFYSYYQQAGKRPPIQSWLDSFILGDVYMLGFGMDFSELDIWWLLNRKKRETAAKGRVYFYAPDRDTFDEKVELLKLLNVEVVHCGVPTPTGTSAEKNDLYCEFYLKAIADIEKKVSQNSLWRK